jgi:putative transposase
MVAGKPAYVYRAIDGHGQVVDVYVSTRRATADAATLFRRAVESTGVIPDEVTTDGAATYPPTLDAALPPVAHEVGKQLQQRIERDHQHLKGQLRPMRGFKTRAGARVRCLPARPAWRLLRPQAPGRRHGEPAAAAGRAGAGRPDGDTPGPLTPATTRLPRRACSRAPCASVTTTQRNSIQ